MTEFITGVVLGGLLVFCIMEINHWKSVFLHQASANVKQESNTQWQNLMNYNGSERGQMNIEN